MDKTTGIDYRKTERDPAEIRSDIEETRAHPGETVEEIKERFSPEHVKSHGREATVGRAKGAIKTTAERTLELSTAALERVKRDPLPYLSIGAGLGMGIGGLFWLLKRQGKNGHGYGYEEEGSVPQPRSSTPRRPANILKEWPRARKKGLVR